MEIIGERQMGTDNIRDEEVRIDSSAWKIIFFPDSGRITIARRDLPKPKISRAFIELDYSTPDYKRLSADYSGGTTSLNETR
jgi:hypothetical protein